MYATKDFIVTYNDANTDGSDGKHASKLYLYRPDLDQLHVDYQNVGASVFNGTRTMMKDERVFYTPVGDSNYNAVDIHVIQARTGSANISFPHNSLTDFTLMLHSRYFAGLLPVDSFAIFKASCSSSANVIIEFPSIISFM